jgi:ribosomal-protein-alanine N-acetyltransferase
VILRAIDIDGIAVGSIGIFLKDDVYCKSAELGYWLGEPFWGKGIMTQAVKQICKMAFEKYDIVRIFAEPYADNTASRRVLEKAGFRLEGILRKSVYKKGQIMDSCIYALIKDEAI